jgi:hypothetical protein
MSIQQIERSIDTPRLWRLSWLTVVVFAVAFAYIDGFWVTSLQGAIGSLERSRPPFQRWLRDSTLMLPVYVGAVMVALLLTRRWAGRSRRALARIGAATVLIVGICTAVGVAEVANSSAFDYHLQTEHLEEVEALNHAHTPEGRVLPVADADSDANSEVCLGLCAAKRSTRDLHVRAVTRAGVVLLLTNSLLVIWLLALRGGQLWKRADVTGIPEGSAP